MTDSRLRTGVMALGIGVLVVVSAIAMFAAADRPTRKPQNPRESVQQTESKRKPKTDPYTPDCRIIREWLGRHEGDVEVLSWGRRTIVQNFDLGGHATLSARWRKQGSSHTKSGVFTIGPFDTVENAVVSD